MLNLTKKENPKPLHWSEEEWRLRVDLAAAYRLVDYFGWTELIYGHLTAHIPGEKPHFLINPYGLNYDEVTASNLIKIDIDGNLVDFGTSLAPQLVSKGLPKSHFPCSRIRLSIHFSNSRKNKLKRLPQPISMLFLLYF